MPLAAVLAAITIGGVGLLTVREIEIQNPIPGLALGATGQEVDSQGGGGFPFVGLGLAAAGVGVALFAISRFTR